MIRHGWQIAVATASPDGERTRHSFVAIQDPERAKAAIRRMETPVNYWLIIMDHELKVYAIHGPLSDDIEWSNRVADAQERGRKVSCSTVPATARRNDLAARAEADGYAEGNITL